MKSQKEKILSYIRTYGGISNRDAAMELDIYRLSARIFDLRQDGINIVTDTIRRNGKSFAVYREARE